MPGLAKFNLGLAELMLGNLESARTCFAQVVKLWEDDPQEDGNLVCLFVPSIAKGKLTLQERLEPDPLATVKEALALDSMV